MRRALISHLHDYLSYAKNKKKTGKNVFLRPNNFWVFFLLRCFLPSNWVYQYNSQWSTAKWHNVCVGLNAWIVTAPPPSSSLSTTSSSSVIFTTQSTNDDKNRLKFWSRSCGDHNETLLRDLVGSIMHESNGQFLAKLGRNIVGKNKRQIFHLVLKVWWNRMSQIVLQDFRNTKKKFKF